MCRFNAEDDVAPSQMTDCNRTVFHTAVATALNVKRILREQVAGRLGALEKAVAETRERLARIEGQPDLLIKTPEMAEPVDEHQ